MCTKKLNLKKNKKLRKIESASHFFLSCSFLLISILPIIRFLKKNYYNLFYA